MKNYVAIYNEAVADYYYEKEQEQKALALRNAQREAVSEFYKCIIPVLNAKYSNMYDRAFAVERVFDSFWSKCGFTPNGSNIHNKRIREAVRIELDFVQDLMDEPYGGF